MDQIFFSTATVFWSLLWKDNSVFGTVKVWIAKNSKLLYSLWNPIGWSPMNSLCDQVIRKVPASPINNPQVRRMWYFGCVGLKSLSYLQGDGWRWLLQREERACKKKLLRKIGCHILLLLRAYYYLAPTCRCLWQRPSATFRAARSRCRTGCLRRRTQSTPRRAPPRTVGRTCAGTQEREIGLQNSNFPAPRPSPPSGFSRKSSEQLLQRSGENLHLPARMNINLVAEQAEEGVTAERNCILFILKCNNFRWTFLEWGDILKGR